MFGGGIYWDKECEIRNSFGGRENKEFYLGYGSFEMFIWYVSGDVNRVVGCEEGVWEKGLGWFFEFGIIWMDWVRLYW